MTSERTLFAKLADADFEKIAGWLERIFRIRWRIRRIAMVVREATGHPRKCHQDLWLPAVSAKPPEMTASI
jgi:hypothetical protein